MSEIPTFPDIQNAYVNIRSKIHHTPVMSSQTVNERTGGSIFFKCENLQKAGAFKFRGATHAIGKLSDDKAAKGVATHSSGNHAQALALAAKDIGIPAFIVMPENAPTVKVNAVRDYGAEITFCEPTYQARKETLNQIIEETGACLLHSYDDPHIIMGQGTVAIELFEEVRDLDVILAPVGGGGLLSGIAIATSELSPKTKVVGIEPEIANDAYLSFKTGKRHPVQRTDTIADGLRTSLSEYTFACIKKHADEIVTVSEKQIIEAMRFIWERMKIIVEPSGVVPVAAVLSGRVNIQNKKAGIILTGGNIDLDALPWNN